MPFYGDKMLTKGLNTKQVRNMLKSHFPVDYLYVKSSPNKGRVSQLSREYGLGYYDGKNIYPGTSGFVVYKNHIYYSGFYGSCYIKRGGFCGSKRQD